MKKLITSLLMLLVSISISFAGNWQKTYATDEFGDKDYSKPIYILDYSDPNDDLIHMQVLYSPAGLFVLEPWWYSEEVIDISTIKAKSSFGQVYNFEFERKHQMSNLYMIKNQMDVAALVNLFEQGNFTLSFYRASSYFQDSHTFNYKIGRQGSGIKTLSGCSTSATGKTTFKGKIGEKYSFTMVIDQPMSVFDNGGSLTGVYWYGNGTNGKMKIKGKVDNIGHIEIEEYDPSGKKCGNWYLNTLSDDTGTKYALDGVMTNAKGQTFSVTAIQQ